MRSSFLDDNNNNNNNNNNTVDSRLSAVMVGRIGADNQNQRINRSTHTQARYTGIKLTGA
jgi:hypothetical protein